MREEKCPRRACEVPPCQLHELAHPGKGDRSGDVPAGVHGVDDHQGFGEIACTVPFRIDDNPGAPLGRRLKERAKAPVVEDKQFAEVACKPLRHLVGAVDPPGFCKLLEEDDVVDKRPDPLADVGHVEGCPVYSALDAGCRFHAVAGDQIDGKAAYTRIDIRVLGILLPETRSLGCRDLPCECQTQTLKFLAGERRIEEEEDVEIAVTVDPGAPCDRSDQHGGCLPARLNPGDDTVCNLFDLLRLFTCRPDGTEHLLFKGGPCQKGTSCTSW